MGYPSREFMMPDCSPKTKTSLKLLSLLVLCTAMPASEARVEEIDFNRDIRPLLSNNCFFCHGPDEEHREADLRLDQEKAAKEGAIEPGDAEASELYARLVTSDPDLKMPPQSPVRNSLQNRSRPSDAGSRRELIGKITGRSLRRPVQKLRRYPTQTGPEIQLPTLSSLDSMRKVGNPLRRLRPPRCCVDLPWI